MNKQSVKILESCNVLEGASISDGYTEPLDNDNSGVYDYKEIGSSVTIINQPESIIMVESTDSIVYIDITAEGKVDYQWQASNNNGQSWENIASNYPYYEVINAPLDYNDKVFRVVISTPAYMCDQDVISQPFTINVLPDNPNPPTVTLSVSPATIAEAAGVSTVTATLSAAFSQNVTVTLTADGTAIGGGTDYTLASNTITINAGSTTGTTTVTSVQDLLNEVNETVILDIAGVTNGTENGVQQETITISITGFYHISTSISITIQVKPIWYSIRINIITCL